MSIDPRTTLLSQYRPREIVVDCLRCNRRKSFDADKAFKAHGDITLAEFARRIAEAGGCALATPEDTLCSARILELPVEAWALLEDALHNGWTAELICRRTLEALKRGKSCPGTFLLDTASLISVLGSDYSLANLGARAKCPLCGTGSVAVFWRVPPEEPDPETATDGEAPVRFKPSGAALGRQHFRVLSGGK